MSRGKRFRGHVGTGHKFDGYLLRGILKGEEENRRLRCWIRTLGGKVESLWQEVSSGICECTY